MAIETGALPVGLDLTGMTPEDLAALQRAVRSLEHPGLAARFTIWPRMNLSQCIT
jgi:hypothetical protein